MTAFLVIGVFALAAYFVWRFLRSGPRQETLGEIPGPGDFEIAVVGESSYQAALAKICGGKTSDGVEEYVTATLVLEDSNQHDRMAVRVDINGQTVGYLSRENARQYRKKLKKLGHSRITCTCDAVIRGGWDRGEGDTGNFGVLLDLPSG